MDPEYIDDEEDADAQAMAAMMGFSGFGSHKPPAKKRKFNAGTDAYVDGQELASLDKGGKKGQGSGGNTMPLGKTRVFGGGVGKGPAETLENARGAQQIAVAAPVAAGNNDEIDLDDDLDGQEDGPTYIDTSKTPPAEAVQGDESVDSRQPAPISDREAQEVQARIDALLSSIEAGASPGDIRSESSTEAPPRPHVIPQTFGDTAFMLGGPSPQANRRDNFNDSASVASSSRPSHRGERNPTWYIEYYDPSFNENPWEKLEKEKGLEPLCKWPENIGRRPFAG
jgi:hypothetical protein